MANSLKPATFAAGCNGSVGISVGCKFRSEHEVTGTYTDMLNRALAEIVRRWRACGLTDQEAQHEADQFARHFTQAAVR